MQLGRNRSWTRGGLGEFCWRKMPLVDLKEKVRCSDVIMSGDGVLIVSSAVCSGAYQWKIQSSTSLVLVRTSTHEKFSFDDVIMSSMSFYVNAWIHILPHWFILMTTDRLLILVLCYWYYQMIYNIKLNRSLPNVTRVITSRLNR